MVSVITVTKNNCIGLEYTLKSLSALSFPPVEIIIVDGGDDHETLALINDFIKRLSIKHIRGKDSGIYDAMNIGKKNASGNFIHYLNAGDMVEGEPYKGIKGPCLLPVSCIDGGKRTEPKVDISLFGYGYCHQGVILPIEHPEYRCEYSIAADFDMLMNTFPKGLRSVEVNKEGCILYDMTGLSSTRWLERDCQIFRILVSHSNVHLALFFGVYALIKGLTPVYIRRLLRGLR